MAEDRILILDDEETIRFVLRAVASGTGCDVATAGSVREALSLIAEERFAVALLDIVLPDGSGIRVLQAIKQCSPDTEVIIMTSHASVETAVDAIRMGAYDYVHKPFDIDLVSTTLKRALEKRNLTLHNRQLVDRLEQHNRELAAALKRLASLHAAGTGLSGILDLTSVLDFFLRLVTRELDVDRASIMLLEDSELRIAASQGIDDDVVRITRVPLGAGIAGRVAQSGESLLVDDVTQFAELAETARQDLSNSFISAPITLSVPIKSVAVLGVINVTNRRSGEPFSEEDLNYLAGLAGQAAVAIERARHLQRLQDTVETLVATREELSVANRRLQEANAQLEGASRLKSEFLANTSHELRTPLNGILGFLQLIVDDMCDNREEEREFIRQALECSRHLLGLINDVLDIAKIEAGKLNLDIRAVSVRKVMDDVYTLTHVQAAQKGVKLVFEAPEPCEYAVRGDFGKIKQVLVNLVGNSLKFTDRGSVMARATAHPELGHFKFEIVDTGIGIAPERQTSIFEKFIQADGGPTRQFGGTGLGLAICRSLVELMGGVIGVESEGEGKGTRMTFTLPIWREEAEVDGAAATADRIEGPPGGSLVLVVEDDRLYRRFLATLLQRHGYRTVEAAEAETAWMLLRRLRPAMVLSDHALTASQGARLRTGWDLARRMAQEPDIRGIPLIFVTGLDENLRAQAERAGFARAPVHLTKPVDGQTLLREIERMLEGVTDRTVRILLADDDPSVVAYLRKVLPQSRYHVEVVNSGEDCLHVLRTQPRGFDLLLLDLVMPRASGYDVLREIGFTGVAEDLPVLVLTNNTEPRDEEERRLLEGRHEVAVISKADVHSDPELLPRLIERHLARGTTQENPTHGEEAEGPREEAA